MNKTIHDAFLQILKTANSQIRKLTHFQIFKLVNYRILFLILFPLWGLGGYAQNYDWDWAVSGGGPLGATYLSDGVQQIHDIKVGTDNNYYFVASINGTFGNDPNGALLD